MDNLYDAAIINNNVDYIDDMYDMYEDKNIFHFFKLKYIDFAKYTRFHCIYDYIVPYVRSQYQKQNEIPVIKSFGDVDKWISFRPSSFAVYFLDTYIKCFRENRRFEKHQYIDTDYKFYKQKNRSRSFIRHYCNLFHYYRNDSSFSEVSTAVTQKVQSIYHTLLRFVRRLKHRYVKNYSCQCDLSLTPLHTLGTHLLFSFVENNVLYTMRLSDMIGIVNDCLSTTYEFFPDIKAIKNPYTNIELGLHTLYNLYFKLKNSTFIMPTLFHQYFLSGFNEKLYSVYNEPEIRENAIQSYIRNSETRTLANDIHEMLRKYNRIVRPMQIHRTFPDNILVAIMKPFLYHYLLLSYSLNQTRVFFSQRKLMKKLIGFSKFNPDFGRRKLHEYNPGIIDTFGKNVHHLDLEKMNGLPKSFVLDPSLQRVYQKIGKIDALSGTRFVHYNTCHISYTDIDASKITLDISLINEIENEHNENVLLESLHGTYYHTENHTENHTEPDTEPHTEPHNPVQQNNQLEDVRGNTPIYPLSLDQNQATIDSNIDIHFDSAIINDVSNVVNTVVNRLEQDEIRRLRISLNTRNTETHDHEEDTEDDDDDDHTILDISNIQQEGQEYEVSNNRYDIVRTVSTESTYSTSSTSSNSSVESVSTV